MQFLNDRVYYQGKKPYMILCEKVITPKPNNWLGNP